MKERMWSTFFTHPLEWEDDENHPKESSMDTNEQKIPNTQRKNTKCTLCSKNFRSNSHLKRHVDSVHEKLKKHECDICEKKYYQKSHLKEHVQTAHGEEENSYFY